VLGTILVIFSIVLLLSILWQDKKYRAVDWYLFPLLWLLFLVERAQMFSFPEIFQNFLQNVTFIFLQVFLLFFYFSIKAKKKVNLTHGLLGWGDIWFWIASAVYFSSLNFILYTILSLVFSLLLHLLSIHFQKADQEETIPLAGLQALCMSLLITVSYFTSAFHLYDDGIILSFFL
jgi:hypothetical protein